MTGRARRRIQGHGVAVRTVAPGAAVDMA